MTREELQEIIASTVREAAYQFKQAHAEIQKQSYDILQRWPKLENTIGEIQEWRKESERRIIQLEANVLIPRDRRKDDPKSSWDDYLSDTGMHYKVPIEEADRVLGKKVRSIAVDVAEKVLWVLGGAVVFWIAHKLGVPVP